MPMYVAEILSVNEVDMETGASCIAERLGV